MEEEIIRVIKLLIRRRRRPLQRKIPRLPTTGWRPCIAWLFRSKYNFHTFQPPGATRIDHERGKHAEQGESALHSGRADGVWRVPVWLCGAPDRMQRPVVVGRQDRDAPRLQLLGSIPRLKSGLPQGPRLESETGVREDRLLCQVRQGGVQLRPLL